MPSFAAVAAATLTNDMVTHVLPYILESEVYGKVPGQFPTLEQDLRNKVTAADYKSKFIAATILGIDVLTDAEVELSGGREAIEFSLRKNREMAVRLILCSLYDLSLQQIVAYSNTATAIGTIPLKDCCVNCYPNPCCCDGGSYFV